MSDKEGKKKKESPQSKREIYFTYCYFYCIFTTLFIYFYFATEAPRPTIDLDKNEESSERAKDLNLGNLAMRSMNPASDASDVRDIPSTSGASEDADKKKQKQ